MDEFFISGPMLLVAVLSAYALGALPLADRLSRRYEVDIFSVGSGLAGASNVRRCVGKWPAAIVMTGDLGKGALAVLVAIFLGIEGSWILVPAAAAIVGHWYSVMSGFRGGDGMATLGGITIAQFPVYGVIAVSVALLLSMGAQKVPYISLASIVIGYGVLVIASVTYTAEAMPVVGVGGLTTMVLARASLGHVRRRRARAGMMRYAELGSIR